jgi:hypothetical protein
MKAIQLFIALIVIGGLLGLVFGPKIVFWMLVVLGVLAGLCFLRVLLAGFLDSPTSGLAAARPLLLLMLIMAPMAVAQYWVSFDSPWTFVLNGLTILR